MKMPRYEWRATCHVCGRKELMLTSKDKMIDHRGKGKGWCPGSGKSPETITRREVK